MNDYALKRKFKNWKMKARARDKTITLSFKRYSELQKVTTCYYTGKKLTNANRSLDRLDCNIGYTNMNTVVCDISVNSLKQCMMENPKLINRQLEMLQIINKIGNPLGKFQRNIRKCKEYENIS